MADADGFPQKSLGRLYRNLASQAPLTIVTGFCATSVQGRAMHPRQGGIYDDAFIAPWRDIVAETKKAGPETKLIMQIAHAGRQTLRMRSGQDAVGASAKKCTYFRQRVVPLAEEDISALCDEFGAAARRAREAGFDGVQLHAAHGYLIHQFLSPHTNTRRDRWKDGGLFLQCCIDAVRRECGPDFPVFLKVSHADDRGLRVETVARALRLVERELDGVEVSYGTMEYAMNIFRGGCPIDAVFAVNPLFSSIPRPLQRAWKTVAFPFKKRRFFPYAARYNCEGALALHRELSVPVFPVGGIHSLADMETCLLEHGFPAVALCRPFICDPDAPALLLRGAWSRSRCTRCNLCAVYCDSEEPLRCRRN